MTAPAIVGRPAGQGAGPAVELTADQAGALVTVPSEKVTFGTPTTHIPDLRVVLSHIWSAAAMDNCAITDNGNGTYSLAAGEAALRQSFEDEGSTIGVYSVAAVSNQSIADGSQTYVTIKLTGGVAAYSTQQDYELINGRDEVDVYSITRVGNKYHVVDLRRGNVDHAGLACRMDWNTKGISKVPGTAYTTSSSSRYLQVSAGRFYAPIRSTATGAIDTSGSGRFTQIHGSSASGWVRTADQQQVNNTHYNDGTGTLAELNPNQYGVRWVFFCINITGQELIVLIGPENGSLGAAQAVNVPSDLPPELRRTAPGVLISKIVIQKSAASIDASWISNFDPSAGRQSAPAYVHDGLSGLLGNGTYHLSLAERDAAIRIASASQSGLMSAAQAADLAKAVLESDELVVDLDVWSSTGTTTSFLDNDTDNYSRLSARVFTSTAFCSDRYRAVRLPSNLSSSNDIVFSVLLSQDPDGASEDTSLYLQYKYLANGETYSSSSSLLERYFVNTKTGNTPWEETFNIPYVSGKNWLYVSLIKNGYTYTVSGVNQGSKVFSVSGGDYRPEIMPGMHIVVRGSTGNNGTYTVVSVAYTTTTDITVSESIPSAVADGTIDTRDTFGSELKIHAAELKMQRT